MKSVRKQAGAAETAGGVFFTVPWPIAPAVVTAPPLVASVAASWDCNAIEEPQLAELIRNAAGREQLKPSLLRAVVRKESAARPCAVSSKGAQGLMQLMPATQEQLGVSDPFDPKQSIDAGAKLLKQLLTRYSGDLSLALSAYNAGPANVDRGGRVPDFPETKAYVADILSSLAANDPP